MEMEDPDNHIPTCDMNEAGNVVIEESIDDIDEQENPEEAVTLYDMKKALCVLRKGFYHKEPAGLFDLHPVMDRVSKMITKAEVQTTITSYFKKR